MRHSDPARHGRVQDEPLAQGRGAGQYFILLYIGSLLIITRALNLFLYHGP
ncbi:hypothetical protein [Rubrobacter marinus]|uniref:hypothetical protein n=1 Tax=Rubrobacter marinus TaxID=2653852 RepID=UPI00140A529F|nr:hypothetical protein [Rubrobacter marinus]